MCSFLYSALYNHDYYFHLAKGKTFYKCDNDEQFKDNIYFGQHMTKYHTTCSMSSSMETEFLTSSALYIYVSAVHDKVKFYQNIER